MELRKKIVDFYLNSSIHVAVAICALAGITCLNYGLPLRPSFFLFLFSAAVLGYNFVKYLPHFLYKNTKTRPGLKAITFFSLLNLPVLIYSLFRQNFRFLEIVFILGLLTLLYTLPFLPKKKNLRKLKGLKIFIIALVWTGATLWLPLTGQQLLTNPAILLQSVAYFILVIALIIPFEIRDLKSDEPMLRTLPQVLGLKRTKVYGYGLLFLFVFLLWVTPLNQYALQASGSFTALLIGVAICGSKKEQTPYFASFWVESIPVVWLLLFLILQQTPSLFNSF